MKRTWCQASLGWLPEHLAVTDTAEGTVSSPLSHGHLPFPEVAKALGENRITEQLRQKGNSGDHQPKISNQNKHSWMRVLRILSNCVLSISKDGDYMTSPDNLVQSSSALTVNKFFLPFSSCLAQETSFASTVPPSGLSTWEGMLLSAAPFGMQVICWPGELCQTVWITAPKAAGDPKSLVKVRDVWQLLLVCIDLQRTICG